MKQINFQQNFSFSLMIFTNKVIKLIIKIDQFSFFNPSIFTNFQIFLYSDSLLNNLFGL